MDTDGDRSLPGMSLPKWMRRSPDRYDYMDYCASPPTNPDGFFYMNKLRHERPMSSGQNNEQPECLQIQKRRDSKSEKLEPLSKAMADMEKSHDWMNAQQMNQQTTSTSNTQLHRHASDNDCTSITPEPGTIYKAVSTSALVTKHSNMSLPPSPRLSEKLQHHFETVELGDRGNGSSTGTRKIDVRESSKSSSFSSSSQSQTDVAVKTSVPPVIVTTVDDEGRSFVEVVQSKICRSKSFPCSPDITPNSTPAVTPTSSPQMGRKAGSNPFFTGSSNNGGNGSWLFTPAQQSGYSNDRDGGDHARNSFMYETKVDVQVNPSTNTVKKSVRYVPRPSELRELNFWSPTSM